MEYLICKVSTLEYSDLLALPDGSIPLSAIYHYRVEKDDGTILDTQHWEVTYLCPVEIMRKKLGY